MKRLITYILFATSLIAASCDCWFWENSCDGPDYDVLYATYSNPIDGESKLHVDNSKSSDKINLEFEPVVSENSGRITFNYQGVTFKKDKKVYNIDNVKTQRNDDGKWSEDDENFLTWTFSKSLDIVLVLDVSNSLKENINNVKSDAIQMVSDILLFNPEARISIIKFSRGNVSYGFSSEEYMLNNFIQQNTLYNSQDIGEYYLEGRNETALYEAINKAIDLLINSTAKGKGILTFTDGVSNFQFDTQYQDETQIILKLKENNISSYTIGFEGNQGSVNKDVLEDIAINGDYSFPDNISELSSVFKRFSNSVGAVYDLIYDTNNAKFSGELEYRFLFYTTSINN